MVASADKMIIKTNRETIEWLKALSSQNLTMRQNLEEATIFFGRFAGDHRSFGSWKDGFIRKQKKIKFEAQQQTYSRLSERAIGNFSFEQCMAKPME